MGLAFALAMIWGEERLRVSLKGDELWLDFDALIGSREWPVPEGHVLQCGAHILTETGELVWSPTTFRRARRHKLAALAYRFMCDLKPSIESQTKTALDASVEAWQEAGQPGEFLELQKQLRGDSFELSEQRPPELRKFGTLVALVGVPLSLWSQWKGLSGDDLPLLERWIRFGLLSGALSLCWAIPFLVLLAGGRWRLTRVGNAVRVDSENGASELFTTADLPFCGHGWVLDTSGRRIALTTRAPNTRKLKGAILVLLSAYASEVRSSEPS